MVTFAWTTFQFMRQTFLMILVVSTLFACGQIAKTERQGEPDIYSVEGDDPEMNKAIARSRETFNDFFSALSSKKETQSAYSIKMPFPTENGAEHIWLVDIELNDGKMFGYIDNVPDQVSSIKLGDKVEIDRNKISDWFYIENNRLIGGLTIRVLRDRMEPEERKQFDEAYGVKFD